MKYEDWIEFEKERLRKSGEEFRLPPTLYGLQQEFDILKKEVSRLNQLVFGSKSNGHQQGQDCEKAESNEDVEGSDRSPV